MAMAEIPDDFYSFLLSLFADSTRDDHCQASTVIKAVTQELQDHNLPLIPTSYFGATISSLNCLASVSSGAEPIISGLLTVLGAVLPKLSPVVAKVKGNTVIDTVQRILKLRSISDDALKSGLKCLSFSISATSKKCWSDVAPSYEIILGYLTDSRPKVRKCCQAMIHDILISLQGSSALVSASESFAALLERCLLLAGRSFPSNQSSGSDSCRAVEVLYVIAALTNNLSLLSVKASTSILKYFKLLMELQQPIVTKQILAVLQAFCSSPPPGFCPQALMDLLYILAAALTKEEKSAEGMAFASKLLHDGMIKIYEHDRDVCMAKLPFFFHALGEVLIYDHEESILAATESLKGLIRKCVDESLISEKLDCAKQLSSRPTAIEKICASIEGLLRYQYTAVWDMSFQVVSTMFDKLGESSSVLMEGIIHSLADIHNHSDDLIYRRQLYDCVGSAIAAMGPEKFLSILPLKLDTGDVHDANTWLLPILKQHIVGASLSFFTQSILGMVGVTRELSDKLDREGRIVSSRNARGLVYSLWSLLPAFCNYPLDTAVSFKILARPLCNALREEPELHGIICSSIQVLIQQNKGLLNENASGNGCEMSICEQRARRRYTRHVAAENLNAIKACSSEFFSVLAGTFLKSEKDSGGCLKGTLTEFASISETKVVKRFFRNIMEELLKVTQEAAEEVHAEQSRSNNGEPNNICSPSFMRAKLMDLSMSLLPGLNSTEVKLLFVAIKNTLKDDEGFVQKNAYKVLSGILKEQEGFLSSHLEELLPLMIELMPFCHFSAKRQRLDCLYFLITFASKGAMQQAKWDVISSFLTEIILALKEVNKKTRDRAYNLLVRIGHAYGDESEGGKKENLLHLFNMVAGGLAGETPHMISAAIRGLARLAYEFSDLVDAVYNLLPSAFLLLQRKNKEIIKANLGLLKVLVAKSQVGGLSAHLRGMVDGLLSWQDNKKGHCKAKVKMLLEMLIKKCGMDAVKAVMPEEHMKLLSNIRKVEQQRERKLACLSNAETRSGRSEADASRLSMWNHTRIFSEFEANEEINSTRDLVNHTCSRHSRNVVKSSRSTGKHSQNKSLPECTSGYLDPVDLLDHQKLRSILRLPSRYMRNAELGDNMELDAEGRLIICEDNNKRKHSTSEEQDDSLKNEVRSQTSKEIHSSVKSVTKAQKRRKISNGSWAYTGKEYTTKQASGDVKRKGRLDPYAYWPLDRKLLSRRADKKVIARKGMSSVLRLTKKLEGKCVSSALSVKGLKFKRKQQGKRRHD